MMRARRGSRPAAVVAAVVLMFMFGSLAVPPNTRVLVMSPEEVLAFFESRLEHADEAGITAEMVADPLIVKGEAMVKPVLDALRGHRWPGPFEGAATYYLGCGRYREAIPFLTARALDARAAPEARLDAVRTVAMIDRNVAMEIVRKQSEGGVLPRAPEVMLRNVQENAAVPGRTWLEAWLGHHE